MHMALVVRFATSDRRSPQPSRVANMPRSRSPFFVRASGGVQEGLSLAERQPVPDADAVGLDALDPGNPRRQFRGEQPFVRRLDRQLAPP
jgi:hypothetical protein